SRALWNSPAAPKVSRCGRFLWQFNSIWTNLNARPGHAALHEFLFLLLRRCDQEARSPNELMPEQPVIQAFQAQAADNRTIHSHWLDQVRNSSPPAKIAHCRSQQVIEAEKMNQVEVPEGRPTESYHTRIECESAVVAQTREIDGFDSILFCAPSPAGATHVQSISVPC